MRSIWVKKTPSSICGVEKHALSILASISARPSARTHTPAPLGSSPRFTNPSPSCSDGATLLDSRARPCQGRPHHRSAALPLIPCSEPGLSESPGHSFPLLAISRPRVLCFQGSKIAISFPQGPPRFPGLVPALPILHGPEDALSMSLPFSVRICSAELSWLQSQRLTHPEDCWHRAGSLYPQRQSPQPMASEYAAIGCVSMVTRPDSIAPGKPVNLIGVLSSGSIFLELHFTLGRGGGETGRREVGASTVVPLHPVLTARRVSSSEACAGRGLEVREESL